MPTDLGDNVSGQAESMVESIASSSISIVHTVPIVNNVNDNNRLR